MAIKDYALGGQNQSMAGLGQWLGRVVIDHDFAKTPLANGDHHKVAHLPAGSQIVGRQVRVLRADAVSAGTVDIGVNKVADDTALEADGVAKEVAIGSTGLKKAGGPPEDAVAITEDAYLVISRGDGGGTTTFATGRVLIALDVLAPMTVPVE